MVSMIRVLIRPAFTLMVLDIGFLTLPTLAVVLVAASDIPSTLAPL